MFLNTTLPQTVSEWLQYFGKFWSSVNVVFWHENIPLKFWSSYILYVYILYVYLTLLFCLEMLCSNWMKRNHVSVSIIICCPWLANYSRSRVRERTHTYIHAYHYSSHVFRNMTEIGWNTWSVISSFFGNQVRRINDWCGVSGKKRFMLRSASPCCDQQTSRMIRNNRIAR